MSAWLPRQASGPALRPSCTTERDRWTSSRHGRSRALIPDLHRAAGRSRVSSTSMDGAHTTAVVQRCLDQLNAPGDVPASPIVRELMAGAANRLHILCASFLFRNYPRLTRPPLNL